MSPCVQIPWILDHPVQLMLLSNETCPRLARAPDHCRPRRGAAQQMFSILYFILFHAKFGCDLQLVPALGWGGLGGQGRGLERDYESCCRDDCRNVPGDWWPAHIHRRPFSLSCEVHFVMSQTQLLPELNTVKSNEILSYRMESCI